MTELLASIEGSALAVWTRESPSIWGYPTILTLHTFGLAIVVGANAVVDVRLLGFASRIPIPALRQLFPILWWAFALNFVTGVLLFAADATTKAGQWVFALKLFLIVAALLIARAESRALDRDEHASSAAPRLRTLAWLSLLTWAGAIIAGRLLAYQ